MNIWAGAGVGGLRTPARCLDSRNRLPLPELAKHVPNQVRQRFLAATARCNWLLFMVERPAIRRRFARL